MDVGPAPVTRGPAAWNPVLQGIFRTGKSPGVHGLLVDAFPSGVSEEEAGVLYSLAQRAKGDMTLETGLGYAVSALAILQAHAEFGSGTHHTIDPLQVSFIHNGGINNIQQAGFGPFHTHHENSSHIILPRLASLKKRFKFAFIDGHHAVEFAFLDFFFVDQMLDVGGHIAFHDSWLPGVRKVLTYLLRRRSAHYRISEEFSPRVIPLRRAIRFKDLLREHPAEPMIAVALSPWELPNMVVVEKIAECPLGDLKESREDYRAF